MRKMNTQHRTEKSAWKMFKTKKEISKNPPGSLFKLFVDS